MNFTAEQINEMLAIITAFIDDAEPEYHSSCGACNWCNEVQPKHADDCIFARACTLLNEKEKERWING